MKPSLHVLSVMILAATLAGCGDADDLVVSFPEGFLWGTASSAYQSEGRFKPGGGDVVSNWSRWEDMGMILDGSTNDVGSNFYTRYADDLDLMQADGHTAVRIGIEWARVEPMPDQFDEAEMNRYVDLIDAAIARGLTPVVTLYHWVVPTWVEDPMTGLDRFGQPMEQTLWDDFEEFVIHVVDRIADRVDWYVTFNEPFSVLSAGYLVALHPPGNFVDLVGATNYLINVAFMHGRAHAAIKAHDLVDADSDGEATRVGIAKSANPFYPLDDSNPLDVAGAASLDYIFNDLLMNALVNGDLDVDLDGSTDNLTTTPPEGHYPELAGTLDYAGINYYGPVRVFGELAPGIPVGPPLFGLPMLTVDEYDPLLPHNGLGREINAASFGETLRHYAAWGLPLVILENGTDDQEHDQRAMYTVEHLLEVGRVIEEGTEVLGYFHWSITDNFEWHEGYVPRFGLYRLDYATPDFDRVPTAGAAAYSEIISAGGITRAIQDRWVSERYPSDQRP